MAMRLGCLARTQVAALFAASLFSVHVASAQSAMSPPDDIPRVSVPLVVWVASLPHLQSDSIPNFATSAERAALFGRFATVLASGDWGESRSLASTLGYALAAIQDNTASFVVAYDPGGRDATLVVNPLPFRDVVFEAPHVPFEIGTAEEAVLLLQSVGGRAAILSGAHRCASHSFTGCSGRTEVCGKNEAYRDSDVGHNPATLYEAAHEALAGLWPQSIAVSLHGMREDIEGARTSLIISSGARSADPAAVLPATRLRASLGKLPLEPGAVVSCNLPSDSQYEFRKLCGFTNVQGRFSNESTDICSTSAEIATGRFVHIEQDWLVLEPFSQEWSDVGQHPLAVGLSQGFIAIVPSITKAK